MEINEKQLEIVDYTLLESQVYELLDDTPEWDKNAAKIRKIIREYFGDDLF